MADTYQPHTCSSNLTQHSYLIQNPNRPDKSKLTLDFNQITPRKNDNQDNPCFLDSPDMQMLKVGSPELEKMIMENYTGVVESTTPTPTQFINPKIISRNDPLPPPYSSNLSGANNYVTNNISTVMNEQRQLIQVQSSAQPQTTTLLIPAPPQYAAAASVKKPPPYVITAPHQSSSSIPRLNISSNGNSQCLLITAPSTVSYPTPPPPNLVSNSTTRLLTNNNNSIISPKVIQSQSQHISSTSSTYLGSSDFLSDSNSPISVKTEPGLLSGGSSLSTSTAPGSASSFTEYTHTQQSAAAAAINLANNSQLQEQIKQERKRLRNRQAATKCRKRKLEKISTLEDQVNQLKEHNNDLSERKHQLREQIAQLKEKMLLHVKHGCLVHLGPNMETLGSS